MRNKPMRVIEVQAKESSFIERTFHRLIAWLFARPVIFGILICLFLAFFTSGFLRIFFLILIGVLVFLGWHFRKPLGVFKRNMNFRLRWEGLPGKVGLAAELGLVNQRSKKIPKVEREENDDGSVTLLIDCPPGLSTAKVVEAVPMIRESVGAVEVTGEPVRGTSIVEVKLIYDDVLRRNVNASWVVGNENKKQLPPVQLSDDDLPYWEVNQEAKPDDNHQ